MSRKHTLIEYGFGSLRGGPSLRFEIREVVSSHLRLGDAGRMNSKQHAGDQQCSSTPHDPEVEVRGQGQVDDLIERSPAHRAPERVLVTAHEEDGRT